MTPPELLLRPLPTGCDFGRACASKQGPQPESLTVEATETHGRPLPCYYPLPHFPWASWVSRLVVLCHDDTLTPPPAKMGGVLTWIIAWGWHQTALVQIPVCQLASCLTLAR